MAALRRLLKRNEPEPPDDPYAMVTAPRKAAPAASQRRRGG